MKNPEEVSRGEEAGGIEGLPGARSGGEGEEGEETEQAEENKRHEDEAGPDCTVEVYMSEESEEEVTVLQVGRQQGASSKNEGCQEF